MLLDGIATFFCSATALLPLFAQDVLQVGPHGYGWLFAAPSIGAVMASVVMVRARRPHPAAGRRAALGGGDLRRGDGRLRALAERSGRCSSPSPSPAAADTVSAVLRNIVRQFETPDHLRGRMVGISMLFFMGGPQLGEFEAGVVAQWLGAGLAVVLGGRGEPGQHGADRLALAGAPRVPPAG